MAEAARNSGCNKPKLLITGAGGFLGHWLCALARRDWSVHALFRTRKPAVKGLHPIQADLTDVQGVSALLRSLRPRALIHAAAAARVGQCQADPENTARINVAVPSHLADICADLGIELLFTSSDLVFDGRRAPYDETCTARPVCAYGEQKARAEGEVLRRCPQALVCRLPLLFGLAPHATRHFTVRMLDAIARGRPLDLFVDEYRTPVDTRSTARGLLTLLGRARGLLHLGGRTRVSRHALGLMTARHMGVAPDMIRAVSMDAVPLPYPRSPDCSLDSRRAYGLGYDPAPLEVAVGLTVDAFMGRRDG